MRTFRTRPADVGRARARQLATRFGLELRVARVTTGLTQLQLGRLAGVSQQEVSRAECGNVRVSLSVRARLASACGHELGWKLYPVASLSLRDSGQLGLAMTIVRAAHANWSSKLEVPVRPGDARAADVLLEHASEVAQLEIERGLVDFQAQLRAGQLKRDAIAEREKRPVRLIIAVPHARATRLRLAPFDDPVRRALPISSRQIWHALRSGEPMGGDGLLMVRPSSGTPGGSTRTRTAP